MKVGLQRCLRPLQPLSRGKAAAWFGGSRCANWITPVTMDGNTRLASSKPTPSSLSSPRAQHAVSLLPSYLTDARAVEIYSESTPDGVLQLSVAENQMLEDLLLPAIHKFSITAHTADGLCFPADGIYYQTTHGRESCRKVVADYFTQTLKLSKPMDADGVVIGAGCNAVLENLCITLTSPGDGVLVPTPYYAAFEFDLGCRAGLTIIPVQTMDYHDDSTTIDRSGPIPQHMYYPNKKSLGAAYAKAVEAGNPPRILLISHPMNPLGISYPESVIQECTDWCREKKVHLVSDEIYAGSVHAGEDAGFVSALEVAATQDDDGSAGLGVGPYVHFVWSMSKDYASSGLRVGALYSENEEIRLPLQKLNDLCSVSSQTQLLVESMLSTETEAAAGNGAWFEAFLEENQSRCATRGGEWQSCLEELDIPHLKPTSGLFIWMDLREFLPEDGTDAERERKLYLDLMQHGLLFTPGASMKNELPGFFRCVFTAASQHTSDLGIERLKEFVAKKRSSA